MVMVGDVHANQGDSEIAMGIEIDGTVTLRFVDLVRDEKIPYARIETADQWVFPADAPTLEEASSCPRSTRPSSSSIASSISMEDATYLLCAVGNVRISQAAFAYYNVTVRTEVPKSVDRRGRLAGYARVAEEAGGVGHSMARVALDGVWKIYEQRGRSVEAVRDLTLDCADGEFLAIVGPSGCGKSSTMRMIAGLETISRGTITIGDRVVNDVKPADRNIAMVFENYALYPHLSVRENIVLSLEVRGVKPAEIQTLLDRAVSTLDIGDILKRKPRQLSGGQKQRVAIARAIVRNPTVLIMDEPISHIDARLRSKVRAELKHLLRELARHDDLRHP